MSKTPQSSSSSSLNNANKTSGSHFLKGLFSTSSKPRVAKGALGPGIVSIVSTVPSVISLQANLPPVLVSTASGGNNATQPPVTPIQHLVQPTVQYVIRNDIFPQDNVVRTEKEIPLPDISDRIQDTPRLVLCASLLLKTRESSLSSHALDEGSSSPAQQEWQQKMKDHLLEQQYFQQLINRIVRHFITLPVKDSYSIREVVLLGRVLDMKHYQALLRCFMGGFDKMGVLDVEQLQGLVQLVQDAPSGFLQSDDMIQILRIIRMRLVDTAQQAKEYSTHLVLAATKVLNVMADNKVKDLDREFDHEPLLKTLTDLSTNDDPFLRYRAQYALQALKFVPDDESAWRCAVRHVLSIAGGVLKMYKVALLEFDGVPDAIPLIVNGVKGAINGFKQNYGSEAERPWYLAVRGAEAFVQEGMLSGLNTYICKEPCRDDPLFQWGICELLGRITIDPSWGTETRTQAFKFLGEMCSANQSSRAQQDVRHLVLTILKQILDLNDSGDDSSTADLEVVKKEARVLVRELRNTDIRVAEYDYDVMDRLPLPRSHLLLKEVNDNPDLELVLERLRRQRWNEYNQRAVYIEAMSKLSLQASEDELVVLKKRVAEFLDNKREVMLILGDSGAGKSTFNLRLEFELWESYRSGGPIPLFIDLKSVKEPDNDMIQQQLLTLRFSKEHIEELRVTKRPFILICDGYDECRKWSNLHTNNYFNKANNWCAKMIISCRTQYLGSDYRFHFEPQEEDDYSHSRSRNRGRGRKLDLFEEAVIVPFKMEQIEAYIDQYISSPDTLEFFEDRVPWTLDMYLDQLQRIPQLMDLMRNPFLLRLMLDTLPRISLNNGVSQIQLTRVQLYDEYVIEHFTHEQERLRRQRSKSRLDADEQRAFSEIEDDFVHNGLDFAARLSECIFKEQDGVNMVEYSSNMDKKSWKAQFFGLDNDISLLRSSSPLLRNKNKYEFTHRSLLEYFFTCTVYEPSDAEPRLGLSVYLNSADGLSLLATHPLNQRNLVSEPSIIQFLAERVQLNTTLKNQFLTIVDLSKTRQDVSQASANSMTILVQAGVQFNGSDLRGIQIPGANLSGGYFDYAQLQDADMTGVDLTKTWLRGGNFSRTQMAGAHFGERPYFEAPEARSMALSPDRRILLLGFDYGAIKVLDTADWSTRHTLLGHTDRVTCLAFSSTGHQIASGGGDEDIRIWDLQDDANSYVLQGHTRQVNALAFSPDGRRLISGSSDMTVRIWNLDSKSSAFVLNDHTAAVRAVAWSPDGEQIASGGDDKTIRLWQASSGILEREHIVGSRKTRSLLYIPSSRLVAGTGTDLLIWDLQTINDPLVLKGHNSDVYSLTISPDGRWIVSASQDGSAKVWSERIGELVHTFQGHSDAVIGAAFLNSRDVVSLGADGTVRVWELSKDTEQKGTLQKRGHKGFITNVAYSPDGQTILSCSIDKTVREWDAVTGSPGPVIQCQRPVTQATYSPDGKHMAIAAIDKLRLIARGSGAESAISMQDIEPVCTLAFSPCGQRLATGHINGLLKVWDLQSGTTHFTLKGHTNYISGVTFSPSGLSLASWSLDRTIRVWDASDNKCSPVQTEILQIYTRALVFSPCGTMIAWSDDKENWEDEGPSDIHIWDVQTMQEQHAMEGCSNGVFLSLAWSSEWIVSGETDGRVRLWKSQSIELTSSWNCMATIRVIIGPATCIAWNPVIPLEFVSGSMDSSLCVWKVAEEEDGGKMKVCLKWGLSDRLVAQDAEIKDAISLDGMQRKLLQQYGASHGDS